MVVVLVMLVVMINVVDVAECLWMVWRILSTASVYINAEDAARYCECLRDPSVLFGLRVASVGRCIGNLAASCCDEVNA